MADSESSTKQKVDVQCGVCGFHSFQLVPREAAVEAAPDFDTRPKQNFFDPLQTWVAECPSCGYCSADISVATPPTPEIVKSDEYEARLRRPDFPLLARRFAAYALLLERSHLWADAGWLWLHAAWACDDAHQSDVAAECRLAAIDRWKRAKELGQSFGDDLASEFAIVTDLYRRSARFEDATISCAEGLDLGDIPPAVEKMLRRQLTLIQARDIAAHSMSELLGREPSESSC